MEKLSLFLLSFVLFSANAFSVENNPQRYPIGNLEHPVTAKEYCTFLHQNSDARHDGDSLWSWYFENFYDHQLMDSEMGKSPIILRSGEPKNYDYSVAEGCDDIIILNIESQVAQRAFEKWRRYLSLGDVCNYLNDQIVIQWGVNHPDDFSTEGVQRAQAAVETIRSGYNYGYKTEFEKMDHVVDLLLQNEAQESYILEGKQCESIKRNAVCDESVVLIISFQSSAEKPVVTLVNNVNKYERLDLDGAISCNDTHLQFPKSLGASVIPTYDSVHDWDSF